MLGFFKIIRGIIILSVLCYVSYYEYNLYKQLEVINKKENEYKISLEEKLNKTFKARGENFYRK